MMFPKIAKLGMPSASRPFVKADKTGAVPHRGASDLSRKKVGATQWPPLFVNSKAVNDQFTP